MDHPNFTPAASPHWPFLGLVRLALGWIFVWAFLDKVWGLGFTTEAGKAWLDGVSPTLGFLKFASQGPLAPMYQSVAGQAWVDWMFMLGLLLIGLALMFGVGLRVAGWTGGVLMLLMFTAVLPPEHNPVIDEHIIYLIILLGIASHPQAFHWLSFGRHWNQTALVQRNRWLA